MPDVREPDAEGSAASAAADRPLVVLVCADLIQTSALSGIAADLGLRFHAVSDLAVAVELLGHSAGGRLFVDLGTPGLRPEQLSSQIPEAMRQTAVAYGPHVHENLLNHAREAGFGQVLSRGQFHARSAQLLRQVLM